jgi:hypothetical protein
MNYSKKFNIFILGISTGSIRLLIFTGIFIISAAIFAETIELKDGSVVNGRIINQNKEKVDVRTSSGEVKVLPKSSIRKISYGTVESSTEEKAQAEQAKIMEKARQDMELKKDSYLSRDDLIWGWMHRDYKNPPKEKDLVKSNVQPAAEDQITFLPDSGSAVKLSGVLWRNALLPGWGDMYAGHTNTAYLKGGAFGAALISTVYFQNKYNNEKKDYLEKSATYMNTWQLGLSQGVNMSDGTVFLYLHSLDSNSYHNFNNSARYLNNSLIVLGTLYAGNLIHSLFLTKDLFAGNEENSNVHLSVIIAPIPVLKDNRFAMENRVEALIQVPF